MELTEEQRELLISLGFECGHIGKLIQHKDLTISKNETWRKKIKNDFHILSIHFNTDYSYCELAMDDYINPEDFMLDDLIIELKKRYQ